METDIVVIGGGSAGCAVAHRLSEDGRLSVLLLEAGGSDKHPFTRVPALNIMAVQNPRFDWCYKTEADPSRGGRVDHWAAGKVLGGSSSINGMMFIRGHRQDYDDWAALGCTGWDYASVLPYFRRMETNLRGGDAWRGDSGPQAVSEVRLRHPLTDVWMEAVQQAGVPRCKDLNGEAAEGVDYVQASQKNGWRHSTAAAYIWPAKSRRNLAVELGALVQRVRIDNGRATGVEYLQGGQAKTVTARRGVVVCGGTMASPKLLMQSGVGPAQQLRELGIAVAVDAPGVGQNLQDHVGVHYVSHVNVPTLNTQRGALSGLSALFDFFARGRGMMTTPIGHAQAFVKTRDPSGVPNLQLIFLPMSFDLDDKGAIKLSDDPSVSVMIAVNRPQSRGAITLRSADPADKPVIRYAQLDADDDLEQLAEGLLFTRRIMQQPALAPYGVREKRPGANLSRLDELRDFARLASGCMYHPSGTCRMGGDAGSVVDPTLGVRGVDGLWVADASVMPQLTAGNINATVIMIGEKAADHIKAAV